MAVIDLYRLKTINDSLEHAAADGCLSTAATGPGDAIRNSDVAADLEGDEVSARCPTAPPPGPTPSSPASTLPSIPPASPPHQLGSLTTAHGFTAALAEAGTAMYATTQHRREHYVTSDQ